jgi:hypothetical protein
MQQFAETVFTLVVVQIWKVPNETETPYCHTAGQDKPEK